MIKVIGALFLLCVAAMCCWAFVWPFVWPIVWPFLVSANPDNSIYHYGSITTLVMFFGSIVMLLAIRVYTPDEEWDLTWEDGLI